MARRSVSKEIKAAALADLAAGEQPAVVAERYKIAAGTVRQWKSRLVIEVPDGQVVTPVVTLQPPLQRPTFQHRQAEIADLVIRNLIAKLKATEAIALHVSTTDWLDKQSASSLAELFESLDRAAIIILDRLAGRGPADQSGD